MKFDLTKVSLALVSLVFILGCQDQALGPVGPDGPQFDKKGTPGDDCPEGLVQKVRDENGHCHSVEEPPEDAPKFNITMVSTAGAGPNFVAIETTRPIRDLTLDLRSFNGPTGCALLTDETGTFSLIKGDADGPHVHIHFSFMHRDSGTGVESQHGLGMPGVPVATNGANADWGDPTMTRTAEESPNGNWGINSKGRNHNAGCEAEGNGLEFTITVEPVPAP